jgi:hypothetical protein
MKSYFLTHGCALENTYSSRNHVIPNKYQNKFKKKCGQIAADLRLDIICREFTELASPEGSTIERFDLSRGVADRRSVHGDRGEVVAENLAESPAVAGGH